MKHVLGYALCLSCLVAQDLAAEKIIVSEEVRKILEENYRDYRENVRKVAEKETRGQMSAGLLQKAESVRLPICDLERSPMGWQFTTPNEGEHVLKYIGAQGSGAQFLRWTDSIWVRLSGSRERFREGMYCGEGERTYATIELDRAFWESAKDGTLLQLASSFTAKRTRTMKAEVTLSVEGDSPVRIVLEMWSSNGERRKLLASTIEEVASGKTQQPKTLRVEAPVLPMQETFVVARLDPSTTCQAASKLLVHGGSVGPKG